MASKAKAAGSRPKKGWLGSGKRPPADPNWASRRSKRKKARRVAKTRTPQAQAAIEAYAAAAGNVSEAKRLLAERGLTAQGLESNPEMRKAASKRLEEALAAAGVDAVRTLTEVRRIAYMDPRRLFDGRELKAMEDLGEDEAAAISSVEVKTRRWTDRGGNDQEEETSKVRMWDKGQALTTLLKVQELMPERHEHTGRGGGPIPIDAGPQESRTAVMASLLAMIQPKKDPKS